MWGDGRSMTLKAPKCQAAAYDIQQCVWQAHKEDLDGPLSNAIMTPSPRYHWQALWGPGGNCTFSPEGGWASSSQGPSHCGVKACHRGGPHWVWGVDSCNPLFPVLWRWGWLGGGPEAHFPFRQPWKVCVLWMKDRFFRGKESSLGFTFGSRNLLFTQTTSCINLYSES